jgi:hypothetical protein
MAATKPYTWEDSETEVKLLLPVDAGIKGKDIVFVLTPTALTLGIKGQARARTALHLRARMCRGCACHWPCVLCSARADCCGGCFWPQLPSALCVACSRLLLASRCGAR